MLGLYHEAAAAQIAILHEIGHVMIDARPGIIGDYRAERKWEARYPGDSDVPHDGWSTFPGHDNPYEDLATSLAIFITSGGRAYPPYQFQMDFVRNYQGRWQR